MKKLATFMLNIYVMWFCKTEAGTRTDVWQQRALRWQGAGLGKKPCPFMHCSLFIVLILKIALLKLLKKFFYWKWLFLWMNVQVSNQRCQQFVSKLSCISSQWTQQLSTSKCTLSAEITVQHVLLMTLPKAADDVIWSTFCWVYFNA